MAMNVKDQVITENYAAFNGDCVEVMKALPSDSIHLSIYSPFGGLYNYSSDERDMSNCRDYKQFFEHYSYVVKEISRLTVSGRCSAVHCMDVPNGNCQFSSYTDFPATSLGFMNQKGLILSLGMLSGKNH